jgi:hypothetical protein
MLAELIPWNQFLILGLQSLKIRTRLHLALSQDCAEQNIKGTEV